MAKNRDLNNGEQRVFNELLKGKQSIQIGLDLHLATTTVKFHLTNIYRKMGVNNDRALMALQFAKHREELEAKFLNNECISLSLHESRMWAAEEREKNLAIKIEQLEKENAELKRNQKLPSDKLPLGLTPITGI